MRVGKPCVLSIAGFDPSGGAGVLADIKTFEAHRVTGLGVVTGLTFQNDVEMDGVEWVSTATVLRQIEVLLRRFVVPIVKIGIVRDAAALQEIVDYLVENVPDARIVWDPVLKATAGYRFHGLKDSTALLEAASRVFLMTPNLEEARELTGEQDITDAGRKLARFCHVLLKGGHNEDHPARDYLFVKSGETKILKAKRVSAFPKHGSGCVLSSAIAANLARGLDLRSACARAKTYVTRFLMSSNTIVGYHPA